MVSSSAIGRRDFLKASAAAGGGLLISLYLPEASSGRTPSGKQVFAPNAFVRIGTDDTVTVILGKSEMGTGIYTALPMLVAEELEADWHKVRVEAAPVDPVYYHPGFRMQMTGGSTSVQSEWERLRKAGATARVMLITAAAQRWNVDVQSCRAERGYVIHPSSGRRLSFGALADSAATIPVPADVPLKDPSQFTLIGKPTRRLDTPSKTNGNARFGIDARVPGMLTCLIARPPVFGAKPVRINDEKTKRIAGVTAVVPTQAGVAVVANSFWPAKLGRDVIDIEWDEGANATISTARLREQYSTLAKKPGRVARKDGDPAQALQSAAKQITAEYEVPFLAHATMEPLNCLVDLRAGRCEIWTGTQFQSVDRAAAAKVAGLKPESVQLHTLLLGGGFGRRASPISDFVTEAVEVAKAVDAPVKVVWTREDDVRGGWYRPMAYDRVTAGLDEHGNPVAWSHTVVSQSIMAGTMFESFIKDGLDLSSVEGAVEMAYAIPNVVVDLHTVKVGIPVCWWRSVGNSHTAFVVESFIDELAHAAGKDPYEFRRALLTKQPRHLAALELAATKANWGAPLPKGHGRGIALHFCFDTYVAGVAEVSISEQDTVRVHRFVAAVDCGRVVNPDGVAAQIEGGIVFALSAALKGEITVEGGRVQQSNFHDYQMLRINEAPQIEVHIVSSTERPSGVGEPGVPPAAPAVANAIFAATGKRVRKLPIRMSEAATRLSDFTFG
jgi:isoquinoline 1-oxidoreductase beta subunit